MEAYLDTRQALVRKERSLRYDAAKLASLTEAERRAEDKVAGIRERERKVVWDAEPELFPGLHFLTASNTIQRTELFKILRRIPKGCLLHGHMDAMNEASFLISAAFSHPEMHVASPFGPISASDPLPTWPLESQLSFKALPRSYIAPSSTVFDVSYKAGDWIPVSRVRDAYEGGASAFDTEIERLITIAPGTAYDEFNTSDKIWTKFGSTFITAEGLLFFEPTYRAYLRQLILTAVDDGISYLELRVNFLSKTMVDASGQDSLGHADWIRIYGEVVEEVKDELRAKGRGDDFWDATIIYTTVRFIDNDALKVAMEDCLTLKQSFPHLIRGFDLVGHEDSLNPLSFYLPTLLWFQERQKELGVSIPFVFHAGETLSDGVGADQNLFDAVLLGTKRIGHGFSLSKHPELMGICRDRKIAIEVCPCSNEALRYTPSILNHPLQIFLNNSVPVVISNDDPQVFGNHGLSYDMFQIINGSEATGLASLGVLARGSIEHSLMTYEEKEKCFGMWDRKWAAFVEELAENGSE